MRNNRKDCPKCGRSNSVKMRRDEGKDTEHCFGVDCNYYSASTREIELDDILVKPIIKTFDKELLIEARSHPESLKFLQQYFCSDANANIYYYPRDRRVVFNYKGLYVGRALDKGIQPKWYVYTDTETPFVVQKYNVARSEGVILVEDCISACNASRVMDSIALLGTNLSDLHLTDVLKYDKIYIALDEDATSKALKMQQILELVKHCRVIPLKKDIKYMGLDELERLIV